MSNKIDDLLQSFDARDWASAFVEQARKTPGLERDESTMVAWFANALMRGYDEHARKFPKEAPLDVTSDMPTQSSGTSGEIKTN